MQSSDNAVAELERAFLTLQTAVVNPAPESVPGDTSDILQEMHAALNRLSQSGDDLVSLLEECQDALQSIDTTLEADDVVDTLVGRLQVFTDQMGETIGEEQGAFRTAVAELSDLAAEELQGWMIQITEHLSDQIGEAHEQVRQAVVEGLHQLSEALRAEIDHVGEKIVADVKTRCGNAVETVVDKAVEQALHEITQTLIMTEIGTTITSVIGPYLPAVIALRHTLGALQAALDTMRAGF